MKATPRIAMIEGSSLPVVRYGLFCQQMRYPRRRLIALSIALVFKGPMIAFLTIFALSARIPNRWQEVTAGMKRNEIAKFLACATSASSHRRGGSDEWRIMRFFGDWLLIVGYNTDDSFNHAHLRYSTPLFGEYTRARNYSMRDETYDVGAQE